MKKLFLFVLLFFSFRLPAQPERQSILSQIPYVPKTNEQPALQLLNVEDALKALDPLPDFQIPQRLPNEFVLTSSGRELMKRSQEANEFLVDRHPEKAVEIFRECVKKWPEELGIRVALADSLYADGQHREAVKEYQYVLNRTPLNFKCLNNLAWLYATTTVPGLKDLDAAEALADRAKVVQPRSHHLWSTLSQIYYGKGEYPQAEGAINNALMIVQQMQVDLNIVVSYLVQRDRCVLARQATSLLE